MIEKDKINQIVGELVMKEKYKFIQPAGLIGEIVRDAFEELEKEE